MPSPTHKTRPTQIDQMEEIMFDNARGIYAESTHTIGCYWRETSSGERNPTPKNPEYATTLK